MPSATYPARQSKGKYRVAARSVSTPMPSQVTLAEVAKHAAVSVATASRALNGKPNVSRNVRSRVLASAKELGYTTGPKVLALLVPDSENPFFLNLRLCFQNALERAGYHLVIATSDGGATREHELIEFLRRTGVSGVFYIAKGNSLPFQSNEKSPFAVVVLDRQIKAGRFDFVGVDNRGGAKLAVSHLAELGHHTVGFVAGRIGTSTALERRAGFLDGINEYGLETSAEWRWDGDFLFDSGSRAGEQFAQLPKGQRPTAVFASNDLMALGFIRSLQDNSIQVPMDVSVVGFDDIGYGTWIRPSLTTIGQPSHRIAVEAMNLMLERISEQSVNSEGPKRPPRSITLDPELIDRDSTANIRSITKREK